jgi:cell division protein FtsN
MAHRNRNSRRRESAPGWVWMLFGLGLGLIIAIGVYLRVPPATAPASGATATTPASTSAASSVRAAEAAPAEAARQRPAERPRANAKPAATAGVGKRFEFYEILPQFEVVVPDDDDTPPATAARPRPRPVETPGSFLLQAGSFSAAGDADRLQANLALLGVESHVQRVTIDSATFNRVRIGPIADLEAAKRTQRRLRDAGIDTLLMQVPK